MTASYRVIRGSHWLVEILLSQPEKSDFRHQDHQSNDQETMSSRPNPIDLTALRSSPPISELEKQELPATRHGVEEYPKHGTQAYAFSPTRLRRIWLLEGSSDYALWKESVEQQLQIDAWILEKPKDQGMHAVEYSWDGS